MSVLYATVEQLRRRLSINDTASDAVFAEVLNSASRAIEQATGLFFYLTPKTITMETESNRQLFMPYPLNSLTTLETSTDRVSWQLWPSSDYYTVPEEPPFWAVRAISKRFPHPGFARINGVFGYDHVPGDITEATLILAARFYKRTEAPLGIAGLAQTGVLRLADDPDVAELIAPYRVYDIF
jgi:hypothetical protein